MVLQVATCVYSPRDRIAMWTSRWIMQTRDYTRLYRAGDKMLQTTGFLVHLVPLHTQHIYEKSLCQPMPTQHCFCCLIASLCKRHLSFAVHFHIPISYQPLEHFRHRRWRNTKLLCQSGSNHHLILHRHVIDRLQVLFNGRAERFFRFHTSPASCSVLPTFDNSDSSTFSASVKGNPDG